MGSPLRLLTMGSDRTTAGRAWAEVSADVERTESALSRFRDGSDLTNMNRRAGRQWMAVDDRLYAMLVLSRRAHRLTDGRFDPRVLVHLEALGEHGAPLPPGPPTDRVSGGTHWLSCIPRRRRVWIDAPVDSGGLGKGLALRWALAALEGAAARFDGVLLEAGGDIVLRGAGPDGPWRVGIEDPAGGGDPLAVVEPGHGALATSSTAVRRWIAPNGRSVHHLIDPATGQPGGGGLLAVTVRAADPAWAEVWSKALFLAGPSNIGPEARRRGIAAWWVEADGSLHMTPTARLRTRWTREEGPVQG